MYLHRLVTLGLAISIVTACSTTDSGYVAREWTKNIRELGIYPIFPPREDVRVGDVYVYPAFKDDCRARALKSGLMPIAILLTRIPQSNIKAKAFYADRPSFPETTSSSS